MISTLFNWARAGEAVKADADVMAIAARAAAAAKRRGISKDFAHMIRLPP